MRYTALVIALFFGLSSGFFTPKFNRPSVENDNKQIIQELKMIEHLQMRIQIILQLYAFLHKLKASICAK